MRRPGFTLIEIVITTALTLSLIGIIAALGTQAVRNAEFDRVREQVRRELAAAQSESIGGTMDASWGVYATSNAITRFQGSSYASRTVVQDRTVTFGNAVVIRGTSEVVFTRPFGIPTASATIVVSDGTNTATTTVSAAGKIEVQ